MVNEPKPQIAPKHIETRLEKFKKIIWNSERKECLKRTPCSWIKIILFYIIFYSCLSAFTYLLLWVHQFYILSTEQPKYQLGESRIGTVPGLGFKPSPPITLHYHSLIQFNASSNESVQYWISNLRQYLDQYTSNIHDLANCSRNQSASIDKACLFPVPTNHTCTEENGFGYTDGNPCVLIKINRIYGWRPVSFDKAPDSIRESIKGEFENDIVYVTCYGYAPPDRENIGITDYYPPSQGIPFYYYPFYNQKGYLSPFVFVRFSGISRGVVVRVKCDAWAKNIVHDDYSRGSVQFKLLVD